MPTKTQRWLDLLSFLLGRRVPVPVEQIMEQVPAYAEKWVEGDETARASVRRTFERDKDELKALGVPLEPVPYTVGGTEEYEGYRVAHRDFYLPYLRLLAAEGDVERPGPPAPVPRPYPGVPGLDLSPTEAEAALEALRRATEIPAFPFAAEAASALRKLSYDLDPERFPADPVLWVERPGSAEVLARLRRLSDALLARKRVRFVYHGIHRGRTSERLVAPYGLFFQGDWYLVGRDEDAEAIRIFRVSRMEEVVPNPQAPKSPDFALQEGFSLREHLDRKAWELGEEETETVEVRFRYPLSVQVERNGEGEWVRDEAECGAVRRFTVSRPDPFLRWILSLAGEAEILTPPELAEELRAMAREVAALYAPREGGGEDG
jgi:proteasome accessory factor B